MAQHYVFARRAVRFAAALLFAAAAAFEAAGQQLPVFSIYRDQWNAINPAAFSNNYLVNQKQATVSATYRRQWWNIDEGPQTQVLNAEWISKAKNIALGGHVINDRAGKLGQTGAYAHYAYRMDLGRRTAQTLSVGLAAGVVQYRARINDIRFPDPSGVTALEDRIIYPDFSLGIFYHYADRFYAGISVPQVFGLSPAFSADGQTLAVQRKPHVYAVIGKYFDSWLGNSTSFVEPSLWLKYVPGAPLNADLNVRMQISDLFWGGVGSGLGFGETTSWTMRLEAGMVLGEQVQIRNAQWKIGLGYDWPVAPSPLTQLGSALEAHLVFSW